MTVHLRGELLGAAALLLCALSGCWDASPAEWAPRHAPPQQAGCWFLNAPAAEGSIRLLRGGGNDSEEGPIHVDEPAQAGAAGALDTAEKDTLRSEEQAGAGAEMEWFDALHDLAEGGLLPAEVNVSIMSRGVGWRRPPLGSEVLLRVDQDAPRWFSLGAGQLPRGIELAVLQRITRNATARVSFPATLSLPAPALPLAEAEEADVLATIAGGAPVKALLPAPPAATAGGGAAAGDVPTDYQNEMGRAEEDGARTGQRDGALGSGAVSEVQAEERAEGAQAEGARTEVEVTLLDWNDVWAATDGSVLFRGLGQPAEFSAAGGDADTLSLSASARLVPLPAPLRSAAEPGWREAEAEAEKGMAPTDAGAEAEEVMEETALELVLGAGQVSPPALEAALQRVRAGQPARIAVAATHRLGADAPPVRVPSGQAVEYRVALRARAAVDEVGSLRRMQIARLRRERGNAAFRAGEFALALQLYGRAVALVQAHARPPPSRRRAAAPPRRRAAATPPALMRGAGRGEGRPAGTTRWR